jgi:hypothetical protein
MPGYAWTYSPPPVWTGLCCGGYWSQSAFDEMLGIKRILVNALEGRHVRMAYHGTQSGVIEIKTETACVRVRTLHAGILFRHIKSRSAEMVDRLYSCGTYST